MIDAKNRASVENLIDLIRFLEKRKLTGQLVVNFKSGDWRWLFPVADHQKNPTKEEVEEVLTVRNSRTS